jgi:CBS domain-containing protein
MTARKERPGTVKDLMTTEVVTVEQNEKLAVADERMQAGAMLHKVVVDDEGDVVGVVTQRDLFHGGLLRALGYGSRARDQALESLVVKEAMCAFPVTAQPGDSLAAAARSMRDRKVGCLPVLESGRLVGILTESDFVKWVASLPEP